MLSEVARQSYLLFRSYLLAVTQRVGEGPAAEVGPRVLTGLAPVTAGRIVDAFDVPHDLDGIAFVLKVHPSFQPPGYVTPTVTRRGDRVHFALAPSDVFAEGDDLHWLAGLGQPDDRSIDALVRAVHPQARGAGSHRHRRGRGLRDRDRSRPRARPRGARDRTRAFSTGAGFTFR